MESILVRNYNVDETRVLYSIIVCNCMMKCNMKHNEK